MSIGVFEFDAKATQEQKDAIRPALILADQVLGSRLASITVVPKRSDQMPDWNEAVAGVQPAWELWKGWNRNTKRRELWYWDKLHLKDECQPTILHGCMHAYDELYLTAETRAEVMALMDPQPEVWLQGRAWSKYPYECYSVYGSQAVFDLPKPVYKKLLARHVEAADLPTLKALLLA